MTTTYHHGDLRRALLEEASNVLESDGVNAISLRALARSLGVSHAAPSHHFSSRDELLGELAADGYRDISDAMAAAIESGPPEDWLRLIGSAYIRFGVSNPERYRLMFASEVLTAENCPERLSTESTRAYLLLLTAAHQKEPDLAKAGEYKVAPEELAAWSVVHGMVMLWLDGQIGAGIDSEKTLLQLGNQVLGNFFG